MEIKKGKIRRPVKIVITGGEGLGKSTLASKCPKPLFIDTEHGSDMLDVDRVDGVGDWNSLLRTVQEFAQGGHEYKTLVIDTLDWAEMWCVKQLCLDEKVTSLEKIGYGKGYTFLQERFGKLLMMLNDCVKQGYNVVLVAHSAMRKFEEPDQLGAYDRWELKLSKKVAPMVKEWADAVFFLNYKTRTVTDANDNRKAVSGERVLYTQHNACWDAKNRFGLEDCLPVEWASIAPCFGEPDRFKAELAKAIKSMPDSKDFVSGIKKKYKVKGFSDLTEEQAEEIVSGLADKEE